MSQTNNSASIMVMTKYTFILKHILTRIHESLPVHAKMATFTDRTATTGKSYWRCQGAHEVNYTDSKAVGREL